MFQEFCAFKVLVSQDTILIARNSHSHPALLSSQQHTSSKHIFKTLPLIFSSQNISNSQRRSHISNGTHRGSSPSQQDQSANTIASSSQMDIIEFLDILQRQVYPTGSNREKQLILYTFAMHLETKKPWNKYISLLERDLVDRIYPLNSSVQGVKRCTVASQVVNLQPKKEHSESEVE